MGWIASLLLESPAPPPSWLPSGAERRAQARSIVHRVFERRAMHKPWHPGHRLHDLGTAYPFFAGVRFVSGDEVEYALEDELTHLNPPTFQGWAIVFVVAVAVAGLYVLRDVGNVQDGASLPDALAAMFGLVGAWVAIQIAAGSREREIELCQHGVAVRRWTDVWFHREGVILDDPALLDAALTSRELRLSGPSASASIPLDVWPPSAREALHDELDAWGVAFGDRRRERHGSRQRHQRA
jgi:hypothetical protein